MGKGIFDFLEGSFPKTKRQSIDTAIDDVVDNFWGDEDFKKLLKETAAHEAHYGELDKDNVMQLTPIHLKEMGKTKYSPALAHLGAKRLEDGSFDTEDLRTNVILGAMRYLTKEPGLKVGKTQKERMKQYLSLYNSGGDATEEAIKTSLKKFGMLEETPSADDFENIKTTKEEAKKEEKLAEESQAQEEQEFEDWYADISKKNKLDENPDSPENFYDYRSYFKSMKSGESPPPEYNPNSKKYDFPDEFKQPGHPTYFYNLPLEEWTLKDTKSYFKENPPQTPEQEAEMELLLKEKKEYRDSLVEKANPDKDKKKPDKPISKKKEFTSFMEPIDSFLYKILGVKPPKAGEAEPDVQGKGVGLALEQFSRPFTAVQAGLGAEAEAIRKGEYQPGAKRETPGGISEVIRGFLHPEEVKSITSRAFPMTDFEIEGSVARLIPRAIAEALETLAIGRIVYGGKKRYPKLTVAEQNKVLKKFGENIIEGLKKSGKSDAEIASIVTKPGFEEYMLHKAVNPKTGRTMAQTLTDIQKFYGGFDVGQVVKFGDQSGKITAITGDTATILTSAGKTIPIALSKLSKPDPLIEEAKKYKSAEEFVESQSVFRGQKTEFKKLQKATQSNAIDNILVGKGVFTTTSKKVAESYGVNLFQFKKPTEKIFDLTNATEKQLKELGIEEITEVYKDSLANNNIKDAEEILIEALANKYIPEEADTTWQAVKAGMPELVDMGIFPDKIRGKIVKELQDKGYDWVKHKGGIRTKGLGEHDVYIALSDEALKPPNKSQLTDIWHKAHETPVRSKQVRAPSVERLLGKRNLINTVTMKEMTALRLRLKAEVRGSKAGLKAGKKLIREEARVKQEIAKIVQRIDNLKRFKLPKEYQEQLASEFESLGMVKNKRPMKAKKSLTGFIQEQKEKGEILPISDSELAIADYTNIGNASLDLLSKKYSVLKQIVMLGQNQKKLYSLGEKQYYDDVINGLTASIKRRLPRFAKRLEKTKGLTPSGRKKSLSLRIAENLDSAFAPLRKIEFVSRALDGFKDGVVQEVIVDPIHKAGAEELLLNEGDNIKIKNFIKENKIDMDKIFGEVIPLNYNDKIIQATKEEIMGIYLNSLNEGNKGRLIKGWELTEEQIKDAISKLTPGEKAFADKIQKLVDGKWDRIANIRKKLTGTTMGKVEGYWPIVADKELDTFSILREQQADLFQDVVNRTFVEKGFTKERIGGSAPVELRTMKVLMNHLSKVNHFITHALPVRDIQKIIHNEGIKTSISRVMGPEVYKEYPKWLRNVANPRNYAINSWEKAARQLRMKSTAAILGVKISVSLVQAGSYTQTIHELGFKSAMEGVVSFYLNPIENAKFINDNDPFMRFRGKHFDREISDWMNDRRVKRLIKNTPDKAEVLFSLIKFVDRATTYPTWWAAYQKELKLSNGDIGKSIRYASGVTRRTQPTGAVKDLPTIATGSEFQKLWTMFYTHFTNYQNQITLAMDKAKLSEENPLKKGRDLMYAFFWLLVAPAMLAKFLKSGGKERRASVYAKAIGAYAFSGIPLIRDVANSAFQQSFYDVTTPAFAGLKEAGQLGGELVRPLYGKDIRKEKIIKHGTKTTGYLTGLPTQQAWTTYDGIIDLMEGKTSDPRRLFLSKYQLGPEKKDVFNSIFNKNSDVGKDIDIFKDIFED